MVDVPLLTFKDAVDHLADWLGGAATGKDARDCRRAALEAYRELANVHDWSCYRRDGRITTVASYATGTVVYTHSTRVLTLTGGTYPSWAAYGFVLIGSVMYEVASRTSGTVLVLTEDSNPGADVASTAYALYRELYPVPTDFKRLVREPVEPSTLSRLCEIQQGDASANSRSFQSAGDPWGFAFVRDPNYQGGMAFRISPPPSTARNWDYPYICHPRPLVIESEATGTISVTADSATVTGVGTAFTAAMVGSVIRVSSNSEAPTGRAGANPYGEERVITAYTSATSVTVDSAWTTTRASKKYVVSDPLDIDVNVMENAYLRCAKARLASDRRDKNYQQAQRDWMYELQLAQSSDSRSKVPKGMAYAGRTYQEQRLEHGTVE